MYLQTHINMGDIIRDAEPLGWRIQRCGPEPLDVGSTPPVLLSHSHLELAAKGFSYAFLMLEEIFTGEKPGALHDRWSKVPGPASEMRNDAY